MGAVVAPYIIWSGRRILRTNSNHEQCKLVALSLIYPEGAKKKLGLKNVENYGWIRGISQTEWGIVIISATTFGLAHVLTGTGWGPGKLTIALIVGLVFAIVYLVYGITASILMHWFHNYYLTVLSISYELFNSSLALLIEIIEISIITVGTISWIALFAHTIIKSHKSQEYKNENNALQPNFYVHGN